MDIQTNGGTHPEGGADVDGGNVIALTMVADQPPDVGAANGRSFADAVAATETSLLTEVGHKMHDLKSQAEALDHNVQQQQGALAQHEARLAQIEQQAEAAFQRLQATDEHLQAADQSLQAVDQCAQAAGQRADAAEQRAQGVEQVLTDLGEQLAALVRSTEELRGKMTDVTTSLGELGQDVADLKAIQEAVDAAKTEIEDLKTQVKPTRRWITFLTAFIVIVGGYIALDRPGLDTLKGLLGMIPGLG